MVFNDFFITSIRRFFIEIRDSWWIIIYFLHGKAFVCTVYLGEVKRKDAKLMDSQQKLILVHWLVLGEKPNFAFWKTWHQSKHFWETGHVLRNAKFCIQKEIWFFTWQHLMFSVQFFLKNFVFTLSMPGLNRCEINTIDLLNCFYLIKGLWCMHKTSVLVIFPLHSSAFHHRK